MENLLLRAKTKSQSIAIKAFAVALKVEIAQADKFEDDSIYKMIAEGKKAGKMSKSDKDAFMNSLGK